MPAPLDGKPHGSVEAGKLIRPKPLGLALPEPHPGHRDPILNLVIQGHRVPPQMNPSRQGLQLFASARVYQLGRIEGDSGTEEVIPALHPVELAPNARPQRLG